MLLEDVDIMVVKKHMGLYPLC